MPHALQLAAPDARQALAERLGVSREAVDLAHDCDLIDLHIDLLIPPRLWGYDPLKRHPSALGGRFFFGHQDLPRMTEGGVSGAMWVSPPTLPPSPQPLAHLPAQPRPAAPLVGDSDGKLQLARDPGEYAAARAAEPTPCW